MIKNNKYLKIVSISKTAFFLVSILVLGACIVFVISDWLSPYSLAPKGESIFRLHAALMIVLTVALISVAWYQLNSLNKTAQRDFMVRVTERYYTQPMMDARKIIHQYYMLNNEDKKLISNNILESKNDSDGKFVTLLALLEYFEDLAFFCNSNAINTDDIIELFGYSMCFYHELFDDVIKHRRKKSKCDDYFKEIETLCEKIKQEKNVRT